ncbi:MAG: GNAT family N-acetyltransferase [Faecousia sp.]
MFLETERLLLRKFREEDFEDFCEYAMDEDMCRMMGRDPMPDTDAARLNFNWLKDKEERGYVLVLKKTGRVIGNLTVGTVPAELSGLPELAGKNGRSLSFSISRHYQRKGLMQEAVTAVIDELFREEGMDYIQCGHFDFNLPSRQLQKKLGFALLHAERIDFKGEEILCVENVLWKANWRQGNPRSGLQGS